MKCLFRKLYMYRPWYVLTGRGSGRKMVSRQLFGEKNNEQQQSGFFVRQRILFLFLLFIAFVCAFIAFYF